MPDQRSARASSIVIRLVVSAGAMLCLSSAFSPHPSAQSASVFINEFHYDNVGTDTGEFIEIAGPAGTDVTGWRIVRYNGSTASAAVSYATPAASETLTGTIPNTCGGFGVVVIDYPVDGLQNGPNDGFALVNPSGTVVQLLSYEGAFTASNGAAAGQTSTNLPVSQATAPAIGSSLHLVGNGAVYGDFTWAASLGANSKGACNTGQTFVGGTDDPPAVLSTVPANGALDVSTGAAISITFTENVTAGADAFALQCDSAAVPFARSGGPVTYALTPSTPLPAATSCTVTILASEITDQDGTPHHPAQDYAFTFTTESPFTCDLPATLIHAIQGSGTASPIAGQIVDVEGIVVGDFQGTVREGLPDAQLSGFFVQEDDDQWDANDDTSEGIFVFQPAAAPQVGVAVGDRVRVKGTVTEFVSTGITLTELTNVTNISVCSAGNSFSRTTVTLPVPAAGAWERYEGMAVRLSQTTTVTETFNLGSFGELVLGLGRLATPTNVTTPGAPAIALQDLNDRSRIILDDGSNLARQNFDPPARLYPQDDASTPLVTDPGLSADNTLRIGATLTGPLDGVLDHRFGAYRIHPTAAVSFNHVNARSAAPSGVGGTLRVASLNVLNYFTTLDNGTPICGPTGGLDCRGANTAAEFTRQRDKIIAAIAALDADVVGLLELQNNATASLQDLVDGLNAVLGGDHYAYIDTGTIGTDAIKSGFIYQPARVLPIGPFAVLTDLVDPRTIDTRSRPPLAQTFQRQGPRADLQALTVVINHFKSKGSSCATATPGTNEIPDPLVADGQENCNLSRVSIAQALIDWLATDPTGSRDPDFLLIGDLNSYAREDPIRALTDATFDPRDPTLPGHPGFGPNPNATYINLIARFVGNGAYSYVFEGQSGYLDHALSSRSLASQITGVTEWHINADEPVALDYNTEWTTSIAKNANQLASLYNPDPFRASDHDPLLVGLNPLCGDLDDDGDVDTGDYAAFRTALGSNRVRPDYDGDGVVTLRDYTLWYGCYRRFVQ